MESVQGKWNGDVDLNDGSLQKLFQSYQDKKALCKSFGLKEQRSAQALRFQIDELRSEVMKPDMTFIFKGY